MSRLISNAAKMALFSHETNQVFLPILTIDDSTLEAPLRFVNNTTNVTSDGKEYLAYHFTMDLPGEEEDRLPRVTITIDNVSREITQAIRAMTDPPDISFSVILADTPDTVEAGPFEFELMAVEGNALTISGELAFEPILQQRFPSGLYTPGVFLALF